jgi:hypothetical protein
LPPCAASAHLIFLAGSLTIDIDLFPVRILNGRIIAFNPNILHKLSSQAAFPHTTCAVDTVRGALQTESTISLPQNYHMVLSSAGLVSPARLKSPSSPTSSANSSLSNFSQSVIAVPSVNLLHGQLNPTILRLDTLSFVDGNGVDVWLL